MAGLQGPRRVGDPPGLNLGGQEFGVTARAGRLSGKETAAKPDARLWPSVVPSLTASRRRAYRRGRRSGNVTTLHVSSGVRSAVNAAPMSRLKAASIFCVKSSSPFRWLYACSRCRRAAAKSDRMRSSFAPSLAPSMPFGCLPNRQRNRSEFNEASGEAVARAPCGAPRGRRTVRRAKKAAKPDARLRAVCGDKVPYALLKSTAERQAQSSGFTMSANSPARQIFLSISPPRAVTLHLARRRAPGGWWHPEANLWRLGASAAAVSRVVPRHL